ncbi:PLP-dependent transferase [Aspergillus filifer]
MSNIELGDSIPSLTPHAVSVSLPTWKDNVDYEKGESRAMERITNGYPRFFIHKLITAFANVIIVKYGTPNQKAICCDFIRAKANHDCTAEVRIIDLVLDKGLKSSDNIAGITPSVSAVIFHEDLFPVAKQYWQHSGDGVSSRHAEFCHTLFSESKLVGSKSSPSKLAQRVGPKRYQRDFVDQIYSKIKNVSSEKPEGSHQMPPGDPAESQESTQFLEERFGRNLDISFIDNANLAIHRHIVGSLLGEVDLAVELRSKITSYSRGVKGLSDDDVYLYPCEMNAIFNTHRMLLEPRGQLKSIMFGFPYVETLKILQKFGPGCLFYGHGSSEDLDDLEARLNFSGNPLLTCPDLKRMRRLVDTYDFGVVVNETIGNPMNVHALPYADVVVSSLTKILSGDCNVMDGSAILNPEGRYYPRLKSAFETNYEDTYWPEDIIFMERNSRDFITRIRKINHNTEAICHTLQAHPLIKGAYYPKYKPTAQFYQDCRTPNGGYGGLLSFTYHKTEAATAFFDPIETVKGPSLGTNFTLVSPYVLLAHFYELDWAKSFGVPGDLIRVSVGLEDEEDLKKRFLEALRAAEDVESSK